MRNVPALRLHKSLLDAGADLLGGGHRVGMIALVTVGFVLVFATFFHRVAVVTALVLVPGGIWLLRNRAARDPRWWSIYFRSLRYQSRYTAHTRATMRRQGNRHPSVP